MNIVMLSGRLARDPELKFTPGKGVAVTKLILACSKWNSKSQQEEADFISVIVWNKIAENVANFRKKGDQILVSGRLQTRSYDAKDGTKRYVTEVIASKVEFGSSSKNTKQNLDNNNEDRDLTPVEDDELPF